ncbi:MAG: FAD/NAD(P)-binding protein [Candidatus Sulfotelmatobacter sp.]
MIDRTYSVVVVGGGFSGTMLAVNLLRRVPSLSVAVLEKGPLPGRGLAYGTKHDCHLLNVPAGNMSALPEKPDHFLRWARANYGQSVQPTSFLPHPLYGQYVSSLLDEATGPCGAENFRIQGEVTSLARERFGGWRESDLGLMRIAFRNRSDNGFDTQD